ncbi:MAG: 2-phosphosulfolactate phosphatase [Thermonemataceae bacterium]
MSSPSISVCLSPELIHLYSLKDTLAVVTDILRATSCMVTGFAHGVEKIIPVEEVEACKALQQEGMIAAAERDGEKVAGFDLDNSPFSYMQPSLKGATIAMTTTNGTRAIHRARQAQQVLIGAFLNKQILADHLANQRKSIMIVCAGWKGRVNIEDTLFAGAMVEALKEHFVIGNDAALMSKVLYNDSRMDMMRVIEQCAHVQRLRKLGIEKDILFSLTENQYDVIPVLRGETLEKLAL